MSNTIIEDTIFVIAKDIVVEYGLSYENKDMMYDEPGIRADMEKELEKYSAHLPGYDEDPGKYMRLLIEQIYSILPEEDLPEDKDLTPDILFIP